MIVLTFIYVFIFIEFISYYVRKRTNERKKIIRNYFK